MSDMGVSMLEVELDNVYAELEAKKVVDVKVKPLPHALNDKYGNPKIPEYKSIGAACFDLWYAGRDSITLFDSSSATLPTGLAFEIPVGYGGFIYIRSGMGKRGVSLLNSVGVIDSDYRGEVSLMVKYEPPFDVDSPSEIVFKPGDRIAQMEIRPVTMAKLEIVDDISDTKRGAGGFGSTGVSG